MELRLLTLDEISDVYHKHLKNDFPDSERKPLFAIKSLLKRNLYQCYGLFADSDRGMKAYAFLAHGQNSDSLLLDYFATVERERCKGYGSLLLHQLKEALPVYAGIIVETERVSEGESKTEKRQRQRRVDFYLRNGFIQSHVKGNIFGVLYDVVYLPIQHAAEDAFILAELEDIYRTMLPKFMFELNVYLSL